jgi:hypothetical protein
VLHGVVYGILTESLAQLNSLPCDITLTADLPDKEYVTRVIERQWKLAFAFRDFMTRGQSFGAVNSDRQEFYRRVIDAAKAVSFCLLHHFCDRTNTFFKFDKECKSATESIANKSSQYSTLIEMEKGYALQGRHFTSLLTHEDS